jgi:hypothetical protein
MKRRKIWFYGSLTTLLFISALLLSGSSWLTFPLSRTHSIPLGTPLTWIGIMALPLTIFLGVEDFRKPGTLLYRILAILLKIALIFAILWAPVCYFLAGNLAFTFTEKEGFQGGQVAMLWFWSFSLGIVILPLILLLIHGVASLIKRLM